MSSVIQFGREVCGNLEAAESREWLVTNGIGGYASGTIAGGMTRRYHGLLIAALQPPVGRMHLVAGLDEIVRCGATEFALATHLWASGAVEPQGFQYIDRFCLDGTPVWTYAFSDARLEKRVWMQQGTNTTYVGYTLLEGSAPIEMELKALVNYRDFHASTHAGDWRMRVEPVEHGVRVVAFDGAAPFYLKSLEAVCEPRHEWYRDCYLALEHERGLDDREDDLFAALFRAKLSAGESVTIVSTTEENAALDGETARLERAAHGAKIAAAWTAERNAISTGSPEWLRQLALAADQFIVKRALPDEPNGRSVIAGYHWFGDWGRDTMIALPGLTLATGRPEVARQILLAFAKYVDAGMLPNNFPDAGSKPEYNSVDAALWYVEAVRQYFAATRDAQTLQTLFPILAGMIDAHVKGTRYQIHVDPSDGLLYAGEPGVQLTWMDAKVGDWVVTPRTGKAVEINALWINALEAMAQLAPVCKGSSDTYQGLSSKAKEGFHKFWNATRSCCYDVIDAPGLGNDASLRPNQILAVSLPVSPLAQEQQKAIVDLCAAQLLTPYGLRSLAPGEPGYHGRYSGGPRERDAAYHQGTVWAWLLGPFALAHHRVYADRVAALRFLELLGAAIQRYGLGTLGEIFDGDAPFAPKGCIAQAWSVGEVLRAWVELARGANSTGRRPKRASKKAQRRPEGGRYVS
jgi:predicted glycogen debranching enzyme